MSIFAVYQYIEGFSRLDALLGIETTQAAVIRFTTKFMKLLYLWNCQLKRHHPEVLSWRSMHRESADLLHIDRWRRPTRTRYMGWLLAEIEDGVKFSWTRHPSISALSFAALVRERWRESVLKRTSLTLAKKPFSSAIWAGHALCKCPAVADTPSQGPPRSEIFSLVVR